MCLPDAAPSGPRPDQVAFARAWADRRRAPGKPQRTYVLEPSPTQSGICADPRICLHPALVVNALLAVAGALHSGHPGGDDLPPDAAKLIASVVKDLREAHGRAVV